MPYDYNYFKEITRSEQNKLDKCRDTFLIGRLRPGNATNITSNYNIQFYVEPLCDDPKPVQEMSVFNGADVDYIGFDAKQRRDMLPQFYDPQGYDMEDREEQIVEHLSNQLIIFHPEYVMNRNNGRWFKNMIISGLKPDNLDKYFGFYAVPSTIIEPVKFEQILKKGDFFDLVDYDGEINDAPEMVVCGQYVYRLSKEYIDNDFLEANTNVYTRWRCINGENVVKLDLASFTDYRENVIAASDGIVFIEKNLYSELMLSEKTALFEDEKRAAAAVAAASTTPQSEKVKVNVVEETPIEEINTDIDTEKELLFIRGLKQLTMENGLQYKEKDLYNFHISVKTNPLTILSGMSGTGKSRLAMNYAKMLDLSEDNKNLLFLPITPSYTEPSDVLGYLNSMNGLYVPSESGLIQLLIHANQNPDQMHMVIFDEMNLSQVEYWFSPFISILEKDKNERFLKLYDEDAHCINSKVYPPMLKVGENIIFVGTVNIDDTTKNFSDRLLDRTFVINLGMVNFTDFYDAYIKYQMQNEKVDISKAKCKSVNEFMSWCRGDDKKYMEAFKGKTEELQFFDEFSKLINKYIPSGGISHRVLKNIGNYILNVPLKGNDTIIERKDVLDLVINQTIMTKIRGTETQLDKLIGSMDDNGAIVESELVDLLNKYSNVSDFDLVKGTIKNKAEELRINGYTN